MQEIKSKINNAFYLIEEKALREHNRRLFGKLATFIESIGGDTKTVKARKDMISKMVWDGNEDALAMPVNGFPEVNEVEKWLKYNYDITKKQ